MLCPASRPIVFAATGLRAGIKDDTNPEVIELAIKIGT